MRRRGKPSSGRGCQGNEWLGPQKNRAKAIERLCRHQEEMEKLEKNFFNTENTNNTEYDNPITSQLIQMTDNHTTDIDMEMDKKETSFSNYLSGKQTKSDNKGIPTDSNETQQRGRISVNDTRTNHTESSTYRATEEATEIENDSTADKEVLTTEIIGQPIESNESTGCQGNAEPPNSQMKDDTIDQIHATKYQSIPKRENESNERLENKYNRVIASVQVKKEMIDEAIENHPHMSGPRSMLFEDTTSDSDMETTSENDFDQEDNAEMQNMEWTGLEQLHGTDANVSQNKSGQTVGQVYWDKNLDTNERKTFARRPRELPGESFIGNVRVQPDTVGISVKSTDEKKEQNDETQDSIMTPVNINDGRLSVPNDGAKDASQDSKNGRDHSTEIKGDTLRENVLQNVVTESGNMMVPSSIQPHSSSLAKRKSVDHTKTQIK